VIVGGGTVRADDPLLTSRGRRDPEPLRVVLSRGLNLPATAQLWDTAAAPTLVAHGPEAPQEARAAIDRRIATGPLRTAAAGTGCGPRAAAAPSDDPVAATPVAATPVAATPAAATLVAGPPSGLERLELPACEPAALLEALAARGCNRVLWECGPELAAVALRQGCVQQIAAVIAPKLLGGLAARTPLGDLGLERLDQVLPWQERGLSRLGPDLLWWGESGAGAMG